MRTTIFLSVILLWATAVLGQQVGDRIVVTAKAAQLKTLNDIVGSVPKGNILTVKDVNGDWFWVIYSSGRKTTKGWIKRRDVVPFEKALDIFNAELRRTPSA